VEDIEVETAVVVGIVVVKVVVVVVVVGVLVILVVSLLKVLLPVNITAVRTVEAKRLTVTVEQIN
jgi:hypothetical protein